MYIHTQAQAYVHPHTHTSTYTHTRPLCMYVCTHKCAFIHTFTHAFNTSSYEFLISQVIRHASAKPQQGLASFWMPFSNNREFKSHPRMLKGAQGMYYTDVDDRKILDGCAGLWCTNAGHCHPRIVEVLTYTERDTHLRSQSGCKLQ
jgi:acetylornithine/succinyldiaminopimelate/putrescine aminotransferase